MIIVKFGLAGNILKKNLKKKYPMIIASYKLTYNKNIRKLSPLTFLLINKCSNKIRECPTLKPLR